VSQAETHPPTLLAVREALDRDDLRPDDGRADWALLRDRIRELRDSLVAAINSAGTLTPPDRDLLGELVGPMAALLHASGDKVAASELLLSALSVAPDSETRRLWTAAERYLPAFVDLERARYHQRRGEGQQAARAAAAANDHPAEPLAKAARAITGRTAQSAARRGPRAFYQRSAWRGAAAFGGLFAVLVVLSYVASPNRKMKKEIAALRPPAGALSAEEREQRLTALESLIDREARRAKVDSSALAEGAVAMVEVMAASPPRGLAEALGMLARLSALTPKVRSDVMLDRIALLVRGFIVAMKLPSSGATESALRLCSAARRCDMRPSSPLSAIEDEVRATLADRLLRDGWAADAFLQQAMRRQAPDALARAGQALRALPEAPSLWLALAPQVDDWLTRTRAAAPQDVAYATSRLEAARAQARTNVSNGRPRSLEGVHLPALELLKTRFPHDQEIAAARLEARRSEGDVAGAIADVEAMGPLGHLIRPIQNLYADLLEQSGKTTDAEALLDRLFALDFAAYQEVRDRYDAAVDARATELRPKAMAAVNGGAEPASAAAERKVNAWVDKVLVEDPALRSMRDEVKARSPVIDVALRLGMLRLGRAMDEAGEARATTLARAEQDFLAVSAYAGGRVRYHLGLGQVYHRMGKGEAGDRELAAVLSRHDPELDLRVVRVYRDLDMIPRATELAEAVQKKAPPAVAREGALLLSLMAGQRSEKERWLREADQTRPAVRANLLEIEGDRLLDRGELAGADEKYAEVQKIWLADAETDSSSANNAALAMTRRYLCTGDQKHLAAALRWFDTSVRLGPASAIAAGNAATHFLHMAHLSVLERWIDVASLRLSPWQADSLIDAVLRGPLRGEALAALKSSADSRRSLALFRREQMLAPRSVDGYEGQYDWYRSIGDDDALRALQLRLANATLEVQQRQAAHERRETDVEQDEREAARRALLGMLDSQERKLPRPEASARARRTHATLWLLRALHHSNTPDEAQAAVDAFIRARTLWPELSSARLSEAALSIALDEAAAAHPPLGARWAKERATANADAVVYDLVRAGDAPALRALKKSASLAALATERRAQLALVARGTRARADPDMQHASGQIVDWSIGRLLNDDRLVGSGIAHARWPVMQASVEVSSKLFPYSAGAQRWSRTVKEIAAGK
jgi:cellulose synthase operon protein C